MGEIIAYLIIEDNIPDKRESDTMLLCYRVTILLMLYTNKVIWRNDLYVRDK